MGMVNSISVSQSACPPQVVMSRLLLWGFLCKCRPTRREYPESKENLHSLGEKGLCRLSTMWSDHIMFLVQVCRCCPWGIYIMNARCLQVRTESDLHTWGNTLDLTWVWHQPEYAISNWQVHLQMNLCWLIAHITNFETSSDILNYV